MNNQTHKHHTEISPEAHSGESAEQMGSRKAAHINICTDETYPVEGGNSAFSGVQFIHSSLPELNYEEIDSSCEFLGYTLTAPVMISCMTGGSEQGYKLNKILAQAAQNKKVAVGTGSLRILLRKPEVIDHFRLKEIAPDVPVIGNIGAVQLPQLMEHDKALLNKFYTILRDLQLDALAVHLNPGQELFQEGGDIDFRNILPLIAQLCAWSDLPIIVKETGAGIPPAEAAALFSAGVRYVDMAGSGGTNWLSVEAFREEHDQRLEGNGLQTNSNEQIPRELHGFENWGIPSAPGLSALSSYCRKRGLVPANGGIISSGGLREPMDYPRALALGGDLAASALPFIRLARSGGVAAVESYLEDIFLTLRRTMLLTGSATIARLKEAPLFIDPDFSRQREQLLNAARKGAARTASFTAGSNDSASPSGSAADSGPEKAPEKQPEGKPAPAVAPSLNDRKFRKYTIHRRRRILAHDPVLKLDTEAVNAAGHSDSMLDLADVMVESAVGFMPVPMGIAKGFLVDNAVYHIPLSVEEPSVIAAAGYAAGIIARNGGFETSADAPLMSAYIYLDISSGTDTPAPGDIQTAIRAVETEEQSLKELLSPVLESMTRRGGGYRGIEISWLEESATLRVELTLDVRDAMGANILNTAAETISPLLEQITGGVKLMAILSNDGVKRRAKARFAIPFTALSRGKYGGRELAERIVKLYEIADEDPSRAVTHNKGIMNGISSLALATANDTRATEAAAHAWAAKSGRYRSLSVFKIEGDKLVGELELPMALGTVGGGISFHPAARFALDIMGNPDAPTLSRLATALGLAQNFAAISALAGEGIQKGHMKLHSGRLAYKAGARGENIPLLVERIQQSGTYNIEQARRLLEEMNRNR